MKTATRILFAALLGISISHAAIIDDFGTAQDYVLDIDADGTKAQGTLGNRTIWTNALTGLGTTAVQINAGHYLGHIGSGTTGQTGVYYDGLWNLSDAAGFSLDILSLEGYTGGSIEFIVTQGATAATYSTGVPAVGTLVAHLADFANIDAINRSAISRIGFTFTHVSAQDIVIDNFGTQVIPEPSTYALMACGLLALGLVRRHYSSGPSKDGNQSQS